MVEKTDQIKNMEMNNLVIANAQKFSSNSNVDIDNIPADLFDLVIVDEAHHYPARTWKRIIDYFQMSKKVFLTAVGIFIFLNYNF
jgi:superfamily II DNA or RNA helicase